MSKFSTVQKVNDVTTVNITAAIDSVTHILYSIVSITSLTKHVQYAAKNISQTFIYISRLIHQDGTPICQGHCTISYHKRFIDIRNTYSTITTNLSYHIHKQLRYSPRASPPPPATTFTQLNIDKRFEGVFVCVCVCITQIVLMKLNCFWLNIHKRIYHIPSYHSVCILAFLASLTPISSLTFHFLAAF